MNTTFKKALLAGTAIVAVGSVALASATPAFAADSFTETGLAAGGTATVTGDGGNDDVWDIDTEDGTTTSDITVSTAAGADTLLVKSAGGVDATADIDSLSFTNSTNAFTLKVGDNTKAITLTVNGDIAGDGTSDMSIVVDAEDGGGGAGAAATLTVLGDVDLGSGTISLDDDDSAGTAATLTIAGTGAQTLEGVINGATAGDGVVTVTNGGGLVTFSSNVGATAIGALNIDAGAGKASNVEFNGSVVLATTTGQSGDIAIGGTDGADSTTTFNNTVTAGGGNINLGAVGATVDTHTLTLDGTTQSFTVTGAIAGLSANDTNTLNIAGGTGKTITLATAMGANIDDINIAANTTLNNTGGGNLTASTIDLSSGAELNITAAATVTGDINGNGTLDIDQNTTVVGDIGDVNDLTAIEIATGKVLTIDAATAAEAITVDATTLTLQGAASGITTAQGAQNVTFATGIDTDVDGAGVIIIGNTTGTVNFNSYVGASATKSLLSLTVTDDAGVSAINANDDLFIDGITLNTSDTLNLLAVGAQTVSGTIVGGGAGRGAVVVGDGVDATNATFGGAIGGTTIGSFTVKGLSTANTSNGLAITASGAGVAGLDIDDNATLNVDTDGGAVTTSVAVGDVDIDGTVAFTGANNAVLSAGDDVFIDGLNALTVNLDTTKTLTLTSTGDDIDVGLARNTSLALNSATTINGNMNFGTGAVGADNRQITVTTGISGTFDPTATYVMTAAGDTLDFDADAETHFGINSSYTTLDDGDIILFVNSDENATLDTVAKTYVQLETAGAVVLDDTALVDFSVSTAGDEAQDLEVLATFQDASDVLNVDSAGAAEALMDFPTATGELLTARGNLLAADSVEDADNVAESLGPDVAGGAAMGTQVFTSRVESITSNRLAMVRDGSQAQTGMSAGEMAGGSSWWVQGFGTMADQSERDGVDGFEADVLGVSLGADTENVVDGATVGVALSYANIAVDSDNANSTETDVDAFQLAVYGDYDLDSRTYVAGQVGYTWGTNDTTRHNVGGIAGLTANGDYDSNAINVAAEVGRDYMTGETKLTPKVVADYTWYSADDYTETGAGGANLNVDSDSQNVFNIGAGVDASWLVKHSDGSYIEPALHAVARYDLIGDEIETSNTWTGGGAAFTTEGADPARASLDLGADVTFHTTANWDLKAGYNFEVKQDFTAHSAALKAAYKF